MPIYWHRPSWVATKSDASTETRVAGAMVLGSVFSLQSGAALATALFDRVGPGGAVLLRSAFGALMMLAIARGTVGSALRDGDLVTSCSSLLLLPA